MTKVLHIELEFARAEHTARPHAFEFRPQRYILRTPGYGEAEFAWTPELLADLERLRHPRCESEVKHRVGGLLRAFLAGAGWELHEEAIEQRRGGDAQIVVTIRSAAAELYALPWELLELGRSGLFLADIPGLLLRYDWPLVRPVEDRIPAGERRGRVLFAWSAAGGGVPANEHLVALRAGLGDRFDPERDVVAHATMDGLRDALAAGQGPIDVLHLLCHGGAAGGTFGLALSDPDDPSLPELVGADELGRLLARHAHEVRMVVLAACDSGNMGVLGNHVGSVAQRLHRAGVQVVVGSRFPLSVAGSVAFTRTFYARLAGGAPLADAFMAARDALRADWASIQLYGRVGDGDEVRLLAPRPAAPAPAPAPAVSLARPTRTALLLDHTQQWDQVLARCKKDKKHVAFIAHADRRHNGVLFAERVHEFLAHKSGRAHKIFRIDRRGGAGVAITAEEWSRLTLQKMSGERTLPQALEKQAKDVAIVLLYLDGNEPLHDLEPDAAEGLTEFLLERLPGALAVAKPKNPIRVFLALEQNPALAKRLQAALSRTKFIAVDPLPELTFPAWEDVERSLREEEGDAADALMGECRQRYEAAQKTQSVRALAHEIQLLFR